MGNAPSLGNKGGTVIGAVELNQCRECPCCGTWDSGGCFGLCPGLAAPKGPEWDAAKDGFQEYLDEVVKISDEVKGCCGRDPMKQKALLDADWTKRANDYLGPHGLEVEVCAFWTSDGKSSHPHLVFQFSKK